MTLTGHRGQTREIRAAIMMEGEREEEEGGIITDRRRFRWEERGEIGILTEEEEWAGIGSTRMEDGLRKMIGSRFRGRLIGRTT